MALHPIAEVEAAQQHDPPPRSHLSLAIQDRVPPDQKSTPPPSEPSTVVDRPSRWWLPGRASLSTRPLEPCTTATMAAFLRIGSRTFVAPQGWRQLQLSGPQGT